MPKRPLSLYHTVTWFEWQHTYRVSSLLGINELQSDWKVNEEQINVPETPGLVLGLGHLQGVLFSMIVVPQLGGDKNVLALHQPLLDGASNALAGFLFVLIIVGAVEQAVSCLDCLLLTFDQREILAASPAARASRQHSHCRRYRLLAQRGPSRAQIPRGASHDLTPI